MADRDYLPRDPRLYSPAEVEALRAQARRAHAEARAEIDRRGPRGPHPRVQALIDAGLWPGPPRRGPGTDRA